MIQDEIYSFESDEEDDRLLATHLNEFEQGFDFVLTPHPYRRVRRLGVHHRNYVARLVQRGGDGVFPRNERQILPRQIDQALQRAIHTQVLRTFALIVSAHPYCARNSHATSCIERAR